MTRGVLSKFLATIFLLSGPVTALAAEPSAYDVIERAYASYLDRDDPLGFPLKLKSLSSDPYKFWRGSKDLFFLWCRDHARDWLDDRAAYVPTHGDLHLGNIGSYAAAGGPLGALGFGMVDFDDSARLPFQLELLQGVITLDLVARQNRIELSAPQRSELIETLLASYKRGLDAGRNAALLLAGDPEVQRLLRAASETPYATELEEYVADGRFKPAILTPKGMVKEILRPVDDVRVRDALCKAIADALPSHEAFRLKTPADVRAAIKLVALRTRLGSSGSQGLKKYVVLLDQPLHGVDHGVILYLKQQIPAAAERAGAVPRDRRSSGERCAADVSRLTNPPPLLNAWCDAGAESYHVTIKEPWSTEFEADDVKDRAALLRAANIWGMVAGAAHVHAGGAHLLSHVRTELKGQLDARSRAYVERLERDYSQFGSDPRLRNQVALAEAAIEAASASLQQE